MLIYLIFKIVEFSRVQQSFGHALNQFHFKTIGTEQTEDEQRISKCIHVHPQCTDVNVLVCIIRVDVFHVC